MQRMFGAFKSLQIEIFRDKFFSPCDRAEAKNIHSLALRVCMWLVEVCLLSLVNYQHNIYKVTLLEFPNCHSSITWQHFLNM